MTEITVPNYRLVQDVKPHYVYTINVLSAGYQECVERRYSAFHAFHREVRMTLPVGHSTVLVVCCRCSFNFVFPSFTAEKVNIHSAIPVKTHQVFTAQST